MGRTRSNTVAQIFDMYTDFLLSSDRQTSATKLAAIYPDTISHDQITRFLALESFSGKTLWKCVKPTIRQQATSNGVLIIDDTIGEKPSSGENELITWHFDHAKGRSVKGINIVSLIYHNDATTMPVGFELVEKDLEIEDPTTGRLKRKSSVTKNELFQRLIAHAYSNKIPCKYILADTWFASAENMKVVKEQYNIDFIFPLKTNRKVALTQGDARRKMFHRLDELDWKVGQIRICWLENVPFPVRVVWDVFKNEDESEGHIYLATSDLKASYAQLTSSYQKRWPIEVYHKSLKQNLALLKSPARNSKSQSNHFGLSIIAYAKLELLRIAHKCNAFALKARLSLKGCQAAMEILQVLKSSVKFSFCLTS